ncbi:hypothetical protein AGABI1DRAFT_114516 [Agaricus bisporus var. burnettii JB137-S8]|uniref:Uncharacterized protein n=1 Tax=Agaricus bisporus var. burnettii (strain JB137-S8 / ATCC MYA-4627 / FGSC 10392) TaxID=597362 RepID=K5X7N7_AGABU|nr:uncharacterized protein AGABI1DRAFT_114516 [Agaricus bisporus var. burnettii JB137-S8]EKM78997.1 hypothetical protein AGABI1DRAFT_114516 [Agaricus bisporus var. burnettii JB137-S8]
MGSKNGALCYCVGEDVFLKALHRSTVSEMVHESVYFLVERDPTINALTWPPFLMLV